MDKKKSCGLLVCKHNKDHKILTIGKFTPEIFRTKNLEK